MFVCFFDEEESGFCVYCVYFIIFGFVDFGDGFFQYFVNGVDGDVRVVDGGDCIGEQFFDRVCCGQVGLKGYSFGFGGFYGDDGFFGICFGGGVVVMDCDGFCVLCSKIVGD